MTFRNMALFLCLAFTLFGCGAGSDGGGDDGGVVDVDGGGNPAANSDTTPPVAERLVLLSSTAETTAIMAWFPATDDVTPADDMVYEIHVSVEEDFMPSPATLAANFTGQTSGEITGLTGGSNYQVLVVAVDEAGNKSIERQYGTVVTAEIAALETGATKSVPEELNLGALQVSDDTYTYSRDADSQAPEEGSVLVGDDKEGGYLRKVESVDVTAGEINIQTSQAAITDLVAQASIYNEVVLFDVDQDSAAQVVSQNSSVSVAGLTIARKSLATGSGSTSMQWAGNILSASQVNYAPRTKTKRLLSSSKRNMYQPESIAVDDEDDPHVMLTANTYNVIKAGQTLTLDVTAMLKDAGKEDDWIITYLNWDGMQNSGMADADNNNYGATCSAEYKFDNFYKSVFSWTPQASHITDAAYTVTFHMTAKDNECSIFDWCNEAEVELEITIYVEGKGGYEVSADSSGSLTLTADIDFEPALVTDVTIKDANVSSADIYAQGIITLDASLAFDFSGAKDIAATKRVFKRYYISSYLLAGVPVYQETTLTLDAEFTGHAEGEINGSINADAESIFKLGVHYDGVTDSFTLIDDRDFEKSLTVQVNAQAGVTAEVRLIPNIEVKFYKVAAAGLSVEPYLGGNAGAEAVSMADLLQSDGFADYRFTSLEATLGIEGKVYADLTIWKRTIFRYPSSGKKTIFTLEYPLFSLPELELAYTGQPVLNTASITLNGSASDGTLNPFADNSISWRVYPSTGVLTVDPANRYQAMLTPGEQTVYSVYFIGNGETLGTVARQYEVLEIDCTGAEIPGPDCTDADGDGYYAEGGACGPQDCDDTDSAINPGATEVCEDGVDNDCTGGDEDCAAPACTDVDGDGFNTEGGDCGAVDCNDGNRAINPNAAEICGDGIDQDCSGADLACEVTCTDVDGDGYFSEGGDCGAVDCDDSDTSINPSAGEACDGKDNDCDGTVDEGGVCGPDCTDADGDGYNTEGGSCGAVDCNDGDGAINPGATEICGDGIDNDCTGGDEVCPPSCTDADGDTYAVEGGGCGAVDCNDGNAAINPGAIEICGDGIDNDCSGGDQACSGSGTVTSAGQVWMDRNLGASQVATSSTDSAAYGDLYQWGRGTDGHEKRTSGTTVITSSTDDPGHGNFITNSNNPWDWRVPQNDNLWQGVSGTNNPCPSGFRLPTETELETERASWSSNDPAGAFASPLKLVVAGYRFFDGSLYNVGNGGLYWSSTVGGDSARRLNFSGGQAVMDYGYGRAEGFSIRCIED